MKTYQKAIFLWMSLSLWSPTVSMAYSLGSDNHTYPEVLHPPLGPAGAPEESSVSDKNENSNNSAFVVNIGYGWIRVIASDGSSQVTCSKSKKYNRGGSQMARNADTMIDLKDAVAMVDNKQSGQLRKYYFSIYEQETGVRSTRSLLLASGAGTGASGGGCPVNYFLPPGSQKSKTQVKCQTRYDPIAGKWVVRYVVVFAMKPKNAKVQKITKNGEIAYVDIDKNGHGTDVIR